MIARERYRLVTSEYKHTNGGTDQHSIITARSFYAKGTL